MKKIFYYAAMVLAASAVMVSCEKENPNNNGNNDGNKPGGGDDNTPVAEKLATPEVDIQQGTATTALVSWVAIDNAASYSYTVDNGAAETTTETSFSLSLEGLEAGIHTVSVTAMPEDGSEEYLPSDPGTASFELLPEPVEPSEGILAWVGEYTATPEYSYVVAVDSQGNINYTRDDNATDPFTVTITPDDTNENGAWISGISRVKFSDGSSPEIYATLQEDGSLSVDFTNVIGQVQAQYADGSTVTLDLMAAPFVYIPQGLNGSDYYGNTQIAGATYIFSNDGSAITATGNSGTEGEYEYTVLGVEVCGAINGQVQGIFNDEGDAIPCGTLTLVKSENSVPAASRIVVNASQRTANALSVVR